MKTILASGGQARCISDWKFHRIITFIPNQDKDDFVAGWAQVGEVIEEEAAECPRHGESITGLH